MHALTTLTQSLSLSILQEMSLYAWKCSEHIAKIMYSEYHIRAIYIFHIISIFFSLLFTLIDEILLIVVPIKLLHLPFLFSSHFHFGMIWKIVKWKRTNFSVYAYITSTVQYSTSFLGRISWMDTMRYDMCVGGLTYKPKAEVLCVYMCWWRWWWWHIRM